LNGREFTAQDVLHHYQRLLDTHKGPHATHLFPDLQKVISTDRYTLVFSFRKPNSGFTQLTAPAPYNSIQPTELFDMPARTDWRNTIGTGPWMLVDFVSGSSMTFVKNPFYWGSDERNPHNKLPYLNSLIVLAISHLPTALAALRTHKIHILTNVQWQDAKSISRTNPEILQAQWPTPGLSLELRCDKPPFKDIRVRKALQMSVDRKTIASTLYGGTVDGTPAGLLNPALKGWCIPYEKWPSNLRNEYSYNPTRAKEILAEAGYPNGFIVNCIVPSNADLDTLQLITSYFRTIGVDVEIRVLEPAVFFSSAYSSNQHHMSLTNTTGSTSFPPDTLRLRQTGNPTNHTFCNDSLYNTLIANIETATSIDHLMEKTAEADIYSISQHWSVNICPLSTFVLWQPYLKGYAGEREPRPFDFARWWIDVDLKNSMGL
jgi:peptide/nickel transport system substrate-binding protein